ncbi:hypothetical protein [Microbacterium sp. BK668]|uniref:hypothetical protein n=1 Tax=Microbacterium sp. BK668 TaxID=2512118 RepID=UPI00105C2847|nr:hypothetical protein [Microbacterium sp. BK668]TDN91409.1 hypothetical protein EV279_0908 [Microbacterium sp. BK668]
MTGSVPDDFMVEERAIIAGLADYARELFPDGVDEWVDRTGLGGFTIRRATWPKSVSVNTDQWIHVQVGWRHWELNYDAPGTAMARRVLLGVSRGEFRRFRTWIPGPAPT